MANETPTASKPEQEPVQPGTASLQGRALDAIRGTGNVIAGANLLESTGPLAEWTAAEVRGVLDEARRALISKKGRGVVFEANTVTAIQVAGERYGIELTARLAATANNPGIDILVSHDGSLIELQLKAGSDKYIRAALRQSVEGVRLVVPADAAQGTAVGALEFDDITIESPTREQLRAQTEQSLSRLSKGEPAVTWADVTTRALREALLDGILVAVADLASQVFENPQQPVDWKRTAKAVMKVTAATVATSLLASAHTATAVKAAGRGRGIDLASVAQGTRAAAALAPHVIDVCIDMTKVSSGEMTQAEFVRNASGHAGAATAEYLAFPFLARMAARLGPIGGAIALIAGGLLVSFLGRKAGEFIHDFAKDFLGSLPASQEIVEGRVVQAVDAARRKADVEAVRRAKQQEKHQCQEPGCSGEYHARGMCKRHYNRWWRRQRRVDWRIYSAAGLWRRNSRIQRAAAMARPAQ